MHVLKTLLFALAGATFPVAAISADLAGNAAASPAAPTVAPTVVPTAASASVGPPASVPATPVAESAAPVPAGALSTVATASGAEADRWFLAARDAYVANDRARFDAASARLKDHPLQGYVDYWALRMRMDAADPAAVRSFVHRHEGTPIGDRAHADWLKTLGKRQDWTSFGTWLPEPGLDDSELQCYVLQYRSLQKESAAEALRDARLLWFTGRELPEACDPLFDVLFARGQLATADVWARFRLAGEAGRHRLAVRLNDRLPEHDRIGSRALDLAAASPLKLLTRTDLGLASRASRELALYALGRAARESPAAAHEPWVKLRIRMPAEDRRYGNALLAHLAARRHMPEALAWYREADGASMSNEALSWKARAALRERAWQDVVAAVDAMTPAGRSDAAWRYWRARAERELGRRAESEAALAELAREHHFYGLLAAEDLGKPIELVSEPLVPADAAVKAFGERPAARRMLKLYELDMRPEALQEWIYTLRGASDAELLAASEFARRQQIWDRAINAAERTRIRHDWALRYLAPYRDVLSAAAKQNGLEESLVLGLVRQESRFRADIVSSAGAVGLMQLMPATARWVAKQLGRGDYRSAQIARPDLNAELGSFYLRHVLDRLDGLPVLATAAYNAGPGRAQAWRGSRTLEGAIYAESIPFNETRDYVKKVLANTVLYAHQLGLQRMPLKQLLGVVPPRGADAGLASAAYEAAVASPSAASPASPAVSASAVARPASTVTRTPASAGAPVEQSAPISTEVQ